MEAGGNEQDEVEADGLVDVVRAGEQGAVLLYDDEQNAEQVGGDDDGDGNSVGDDSDSVREAVEVGDSADSGLRRSTREQVLVKRFEITHAVTANVAQDPETPDEALSEPNTDRWKKAMDEEFHVLYELMS